MKTLIILFAYAGLIAAQNPKPEIQISVNGSRETEIVRGWPVVIDACVMHSLRFAPITSPAALLRLAPAGASWTSAISLRVSRDGQESSTWSFTLAAVPENAELTLEPRAFARAAWIMPAGQTKALAPGRYTIIAELEIRDSAGWNGFIRSVPAFVTVAEEPVELTPDQQLQRGLLLVRAAMLAGDLDEALAAGLKLLQAQPDSVAALHVLAGIFEARGLRGVAHSVAVRALEKYYRQNPGRGEPPITLLAAERRLWQAIVDAPAH